MQAIAVRAATRRPVLAAAGLTERVDPGLVIRMFRQWPFVLSLLIDFAGFICQLIALRRLPIFEVQVIIGANLAVTAVFASWLMHTVLSVREWAAVLAVVVGVGLLGSSAGAEGAAKVGIDFHLGADHGAGSDRRRRRRGGSAAQWRPYAGARGDRWPRFRGGGRVRADPARVHAGHLDQVAGGLHAGGGRDHRVHAVRVGAGERQRYGGDRSGYLA